MGGLGAGGLQGLLGAPMAQPQMQAGQQYQQLQLQQMLQGGGGGVVQQPGMSQLLYPPAGAQGLAGAYSVGGRQLHRRSPACRAAPCGPGAVPGAWTAQVHGKSKSPLALFFKKRCGRRRVLLRRAGGRAAAGQPRPVWAVCIWWWIGRRERSAATAAVRAARQGGRGRGYAAARGAGGQGGSGRSCRKIGTRA